MKRRIAPFVLAALIFVLDQASKIWIRANYPLSFAEAKIEDLPTITQVALDELQARVAKGFGHDLPSPFYRMLHKKFVRAEL